MFNKILGAILEYFKPHYLLHIKLDGLEANAFINCNLADWVARQKQKKSRVVVIQAWKISTRGYLKLKAPNADGNGPIGVATKVRVER